MTAPVTVIVAERPMVRCECIDRGPTYSDVGPDHDGSPDECPDCYMGERPARKGDVVEVPYTDGVGEWDRLLRLTEEPWWDDPADGLHLTGVWEDR